MSSFHAGANRCFKVHGRMNFPTAQVSVKLGKRFSQEGDAEGQLGTTGMTPGPTLLEHPAPPADELYLVWANSWLLPCRYKPFGL